VGEAVGVPEAVGVVDGVVTCVHVAGAVAAGRLVRRDDLTAFALERVQRQQERARRPPAHPHAATKTAGASPATAPALSVLASRMVRTAPGTGGLPGVSQLRELGQAPSHQPGPGSNAIAIGSAGARGPHSSSRRACERA